MKKASLISLALILLFVSLCGCSKNTDSTTDIADTTKEVISTVKPEEPTDSDYEYAELPVEGELNVYCISRNTFIEFITDTSVDILNKKNHFIHSYPSEGDVFNNYVYDFEFDEDLVAFANEDSIQNYISSQGYSVTVNDYFILWPNTAPKCIWVKTDENDFAITINEKLDDYYSDEPYVYRLYTQAEFVIKFSRIEGKAIINGKSLPDDAIVYIYHNYAEVPLLASLECYGAKTVSNDGNIAKFSYNDEVYCLNIKQQDLYKEGEENADLFPALAGGTSYVYSHGNDVMVDDMVFRCIVEDIIIGEFPEKNIDRTTKVVEISNHDTMNMTGVGSFDLEQYDWAIENDPYDKNVGPVETRKVAEEMFLEVWAERYGHIYPINDNPINVSYDTENECWLLKGSLDDPEDVVTYTYNSEDGTYEVYESTGDVYITGSVVYALIKTDGTVLAVWLW